MTTLVGQTTATGGNDFFSSGDMPAAKFVATASGTAATMSVLQRVSSYTSLTLGIYADDGGSPSSPAALLGQTAAITDTTVGVKTASLVSGVSITSGTTYWLAALPAGGTYNMNGVSGGSYKARSGQSSMPNPFGTPAFSDTIGVPIQADTGAGGTQVSATRALTYSIAAQVAATRALSYAISKQVAATRGLSYAILAPVSATRALAYAILMQVAAARALSYDILNAATHVSATRALKYDLIAPAAATRALTYSIAAQVAATRALKYDIVKSVAATRALNYNLIAPVSTTRRLTYSIGVVTVRGDLMLLWLM